MRPPEPDPLRVDVINGWPLIASGFFMPSSFPATRFRFSNYFFLIFMFVFVTVSESSYFTNHLPTKFKVFIIMKTRAVLRIFGALGTKHNLRRNLIFAFISQ